MSQVVNKSDFTKFVDILSSLKDCTDIMIRNGKIQQMNDSSTILYSIQLPVNINANLQLVKAYVNVFKIHVPDEEESTVEIDVDNKSMILTVKDEHVTTKLQMATDKYMSCNFIEDEKLKGLFGNEITDLSGKVPVKRLKKLGEEFLVEIVTLEKKGNNFTLLLEAPAKTKSSKIKFKIDEQSTLPDGKYKVRFDIFNKDIEDPIITILERQGNKYALSLRNQDESIKMYALMEEIKE